jgi:hypothetical protein
MREILAMGIQLFSQRSEERKNKDATQSAEGMLRQRDPTGGSGRFAVDSKIELFWNCEITAGRPSAA